MTKVILAATLLAGVTLPDYVPSQLDYDVESAARQFRIQVYNTYRLNRDEYDRRQAAGWSALSAWKQSGRQPDHSEQLISWFTDARAASNLETTGLLPTLPDFVQAVQSEVAEAFHPNGMETHGRADASVAGSLPAASNAAKRPQGTGSAVVSGVARALFKAVANVNSPAELPAGGNTAAKEQVDLDDLKARFVGYNLSIDTITSVLGDDAPIATDRLASMTEELEELGQTYAELKPYVQPNRLTQEDRNYLGQLNAPTDAVNRLTWRTKQRRSQVKAGPARPDEAERIVELDQLDQILARLQSLQTQP